MKKLFAVATLAAVLTRGAPAFAADDPAAAQVLFDQGLSLFDAGNYDAACAKFGESMRLDPANGTLLNLARCHERQGKVATAWAEYKDVASLSARAGEPERAAVAEEAASRLERGLPRLRIVVDNRVAGLTILRDGVPLTEASWGQKLPIDPGSHIVVARAPGYREITLGVTVATNDGGADVTIPALERETAPQRPVPAAGPPPPTPGKHNVAIAGIVFGSIGVTSAIAGAVLGAIALSEFDEAREDPTLCPNDACTPAGRKFVDGAEQKANASTALLVVGGALAATGIIMITVDFTTTKTDEKGARLAVRPVAGASTVGATMSYSW